MPRLAPPPASRPVPVACRRSISAQSAGDEHDHHRAALLLDPAERRDVLVGAEQDAGLAGAGLRGEVGLPLGEPVAVARRPSAPSSGALPSRIASRSTGSASPSISRNTIPGTSVRCAAALAAGDAARDAQRVRRRRRWCRGSTCRTMLTRRHHQRGQQRVAERRRRGCRPAAARPRPGAASASASSTSRKPTTSMNGRRSAAITGGRTALRTPIASAAGSAPPGHSSVDPGHHRGADPHRRGGHGPGQQESREAQARRLRRPVRTLPVCRLTRHGGAARTSRSRRRRRR